MAVRFRGLRRIPQYSLALMLVGVPIRKLDPKTDITSTETILHGNGTIGIYTVQLLRCEQTVRSRDSEIFPANW